MRWGNQRQVIFSAPAGGGLFKGPADDFRKENYLIADIIVYLDNLIFRNFQDEDLPPAVLRAIGKRQMLDAKTIQGQGRYFDNKSSQMMSAMR